MPKIPPAIAVPLAGLAALLISAAAAPAQEEGPDTLTERYRDWVVRCVGAGAVGRSCEMTQELRQRDSGQRVLALAVQRGEGDAGQITAIGPFGVRLAEGLALAEPEGGAVLAELPFVTCMPDGCIAARTIDAPLLEALRAGTAIEARLVAMSSETVRLSLSLMGFTAAWERLGTLR